MVTVSTSGREAQRHKFLTLVNHLEELRAAVRARPILKYRPHPLQLGFHSDLRPRVLFCGSNRLGKTKALAAEITWAIERSHPLKSAYKPPFSIYAVSANLTKLLYEPEQLIQMVLGNFPASHPMGKPVRHPDSPNDFIWHTSDGDITLHAKSDNQDVSQAAGGNPALVVPDEEIKYSFWKELHIRLLSRPDSQMLIGATPAIEDGGGITWMWEEFLEGKDIVANNDRDTGIWKGSVYDNPYLSDERIEMLIRTTPKEDLAARIYGDLTPRAKLPVFDLFALDEIWKRSLGVFDMDALRHFNVIYDPMRREVIFQDDPRGELVLFRKPIEGHTYAVSVDASRGGTSSDFSVIQVLDRVNLEQVARWRGRVEPVHVADIAAGLGFYYNTSLLAPELVHEGYTVLERLRSSHAYPNLWRGISTANVDTRANPKFGFVPDMNTKRQIIDTLQHVISNKLVWLYDKLTLDELRMYERKETGTRVTKMGAPYGMHDDCVMSLAVAVHVALSESTRDVFPSAQGVWVRTPGRRGEPDMFERQERKPHSVLGMCY